MEMRDHDRGDGGWIEAGGLHVVGELAHGGRAVAAEAGVEKYDLAAGPDRGDGERVVELVRPDPAGGQGLLDVVERGVLDEAFGEGALDAAVMQAENLDVADLVFEAVGGALCLRGADKRYRSLESENQCCPGASENQIATRNLEHALPPLLMSYWSLAHPGPLGGGRSRKVL
jgi:hypothetical protein